MANVLAGNVIRVDTSGAFPQAQNIRAIKYIGASGGSAVITQSTSSGTKVWEESGASNVYNPNVDIMVGGSAAYVTVSSGAVVYIYLK